MNLQNEFYLMGVDAAARYAVQVENNKPLCLKADYAVLDVESSGLSAQDVAIQAALVFFDENGRVLGFYNQLWALPTGKTISYSAFKIHKINARRLKKDGLDAKLEILKIKRMISSMQKRGKKIIAHNAAFDVRMLNQTSKQHGAEFFLQTDDVFCTMKNSKKFVNLLSAKGRAKNPSNVELYKFLFKENPTGNLHDASVDCRITGKSYYEARRRGWW